MAIIGYSLPAQDEYVRQVIYSLARNYQESQGWHDKVMGLRKSRLVIVDYCPDEGSIRDFRNRYRFIDWKRARLCTGGFDKETLDAIFRSRTT